IDDLLVVLRIDIIVVKDIQGIVRFRIVTLIVIQDFVNPSLLIVLSHIPVGVSKLCKRYWRIFSFKRSRIEHIGEGHIPITVSQCHHPISHIVARLLHHALGNGFSKSYAILKVGITTIDTEVMRLAHTRPKWLVHPVAIHTPSYLL